MSFGMSNAVEMLHITKRFGKVVANDNVSLTVKSGTVHAIIGENGAGKTTLMNVLYGLYQPDSGRIMIHGEEKHLHSATDSIAAGIGMVHQHFTLIPRLPIVDNIVLGAEPCKGLRYDRNKALANVKAVCDAYGLSIELERAVGEASLGMQQRVEIAKALYRGANILILDEPTAVLTPQEVDELGKTLQSLKAKGKTIIIITHKLEEVMSFSDEITVLRNGRYVITLEKKYADIRTLTNYMVGHEIQVIASGFRYTEGSCKILVPEAFPQRAGHNQTNLPMSEILCV